MTVSQTRRLAVSHAQQALWLLHRVDPSSAAYHTGAALLVHAPFDQWTLEVALSRLADRHDMLRSTFHADEEGLARRLHPAPVAPFTTVEPATPEGSAWRGVLERGGPSAVAHELLLRPFALDTSAFRFAAVLGDHGEPWLLVMMAHHIATDATSNWILLRELLTGYAVGIGLAGAESPGPAPARDYQDFVAQEARLLASERRLLLERHWRAVVTGAVAAEIPRDHSRAATTGRGVTHRWRLTGDEAVAVRRAAASAEVTPFAFLLGSLQALIARRGQAGPFLVGCPTSARIGRGFRNVVGNFVNTLLFRADPTTGTTVRDLAVGAQRQVADGMRAVGYPFALLPRLLPGRGGGSEPLCRITFNLIGGSPADPLLSRLLDPDGGAGAVAYAGMPLRPLPLPQSEGQLDLAVHVQASRDAFTFEFRYDPGLFASATMQLLAEDYRGLIAAAAADPHRPVFEAARTSRPRAAEASR